MWCFDNAKNINQIIIIYYIYIYIYHLKYTQGRPGSGKYSASTCIDDNNKLAYTCTSAWWIPTVSIRLNAKTCSMTSKHVAKILGLKQQANQKGQTSISHKVGQSLMSVSFLEIYGNINITLKQKKTSSFIIINNTSLVFPFWVHRTFHFSVRWKIVTQNVRPAVKTPIAPRYASLSGWTHFTPSYGVYDGLWWYLETTQTTIRNNHPNLHLFEICWNRTSVSRLDLMPKGCTSSNRRIPSAKTTKSSSFPKDLVPERQSSSPHLSVVSFVVIFVSRISGRVSIRIRRFRRLIPFFPILASAVLGSKFCKDTKPNKWLPTLSKSDFWEQIYVVFCNLIHFVCCPGSCACFQAA